MTEIISGINGNDTLFGENNDTLTGGGSNDIYYTPYGFLSITDFGGVGQETNPTAEVIAEVDTLIFRDLDIHCWLPVQQAITCSLVAMAMIILTSLATTSSPTAKTLAQQAITPSTEAQVTIH